MYIYAYCEGGNVHICMLWGEVMYIYPYCEGGNVNICMLSGGGNVHICILWKRGCTFIHIVDSQCTFVNSV